jgi:hypothetical protein
MELSRSSEAASCAVTPKFYGTRKFITVFTRALYWFLFWARSIKSIASHPISIRSILIFSSHLCLGLPIGLLPSCFPTRILYAFFLPIRATCPRPSHPSWLDNSNYTWRTVQLMKLHIMQFSPASYHFIPLWSKYSLQHPILKHPQSMFTLLLLCWWICVFK